MNASQHDAEESQQWLAIDGIHREPAPAGCGHTAVEAWPSLPAAAGLRKGRGALPVGETEFTEVPDRRGVTP